MVDAEWWFGVVRDYNVRLVQLLSKGADVGSELILILLYYLVTTAGYFVYQLTVNNFVDSRHIVVNVVDNYD